MVWQLISWKLKTDAFLSLTCKKKISLICVFVLQMLNQYMYIFPEVNLIPVKTMKTAESDSFIPSATFKTNQGSFKASYFEALNFRGHTDVKLKQIHPRFKGFWLCTEMRLKCLFCLRKSNWMLYFCCRNVVLLFSLFIVLVEGDIDSSGGVKSHLSLLNDNLSKMSLMNLPVLMKVFLHFADAGIHATSTGKYLCAFSPVSISSLYYLTCFCLTCIIFYLSLSDKDSTSDEAPTG